MKQPMEPVTKALMGVVMLAAALLMSGAANAQSSSGGLSNLFGNIFSGPNATSSAPPQTPPGSGRGPLPWDGADGAFRHSLLHAGPTSPAAADLRHCAAPKCPGA